MLRLLVISVVFTLPIVTMSKSQGSLSNGCNFTISMTHSSREPKSIMNYYGLTSKVSMRKLYSEIYLNHSGKRLSYTCSRGSSSISPYSQRRIRELSLV